MDISEEFRSEQSPDEVLAAYRTVAKSFDWKILDPGDDGSRLAAMEGLTWRSWNQEITVRATANKDGGSSVKVTSSTDQIAMGAQKRNVRRVCDALQNDEEEQHPPEPEEREPRSS